MVRHKVAAVVLALVVAMVLAAVALRLRSFYVEDSCGVALGNVFHTVQDDFACKGRCQSLCISKDVYFVASSFWQNVSGCNSCRCFCG